MTIPNGGGGGGGGGQVHCTPEGNENEAPQDEVDESQYESKSAPFDLLPGNLVDAQDSVGKWCEAQVTGSCVLSFFILIESLHHKSTQIKRCFK